MCATTTLLQPRTEFNKAAVDKLSQNPTSLQLLFPIDADVLMNLEEINPTLSELGGGGTARGRSARGRPTRRTAGTLSRSGTEAVDTSASSSSSSNTTRKNAPTYPVCVSALLFRKNSLTHPQQCEHCEKSYSGKHGRSILRRHYQEKHGIPLTAQPRRTRWDNSADRPKDDDDRRRRMLESKRKWAANKRRKCREGDVKDGERETETETERQVEGEGETDDRSSVFSYEDDSSAHMSRVTPVRPRSTTSSNSASTLPPLTYPTRAPPSIPRFEIFREDSTPFKLPAITPFRPSANADFFSNTPPPTLFKERSGNVVSSPAHPDLATKLGLAPTPKHLTFSPGPGGIYNDSPVKVRSKLPSLRELTTDDSSNNNNNANSNTKHN